MKEEVTQIVIW